MLPHEKAAKEHYSNLAKEKKLEFISLMDIKDNLHPDYALREDYLRLQAVPIKITEKTITIATANPTDNNIALIDEFWNKKGDKKLNIVVTSRQDLVDLLALKFEKELIYKISHTRDELDYKHSASYTFSFAEKWIIIFLLFMLLFSTLGDFFTTALWFNLFLSFGSTIIVCYKTSLTIYTARFLRRKKEEITMTMSNLPIYTILIPLLREKEETISILLKSLKVIDYPHELLDIKFLLEKDDLETLNVLSKFSLDWYYQVLIVPPGLPRSKPRACNYGLRLTFGEYLTIYDAEDKPDPDQLRKVLQRFHVNLVETIKKYGDTHTQLACVQACLNFYNYKENLITRLFTIEYTHWFDFLIPALASIHAPVPLGGTSNHFRVDILKRIGGWDPYIGTEDAEIGVRLYRYNYRTEHTYSTTYEEANTKLGNWFKQRARWNKGYMQTYLVYMRDPINFMKQIGPWRFLNFQCFVGGNVFIQLANLPLLIFLFTGLFIHKEYYSGEFANLLYTITWYNFIIGNILYLTCEFIATYNRKLYSLLPFVPLKFFYWMIMSVAGYYAVYELLTRPGYWYKTEHGISKQKKPDIDFPK